MLPLLNFVKWKGSSAGTTMSYSMLVDLTQIQVRNVFLFCFGMCFARQIFGDNIHCQRDGAQIDQVYLDTKCYINATHTNFSRVENAIVPILYHDYYQWVPVILLLMAFSFHFPCRTWCKYMNGYLNEITNKIADMKDCERILHVVTQSKGNSLYWKTVALEFLYALHFMLQIWISNKIFHQIWALSSWTPSAIAILFPEQANCFYEYFSSGLETTGRYRCLLPLNSVYRKVFWVVYFTFITLGVLHVLFLVYRLSLVYRVGFKRINMWWCMKIAASRAQTWYAKQTLLEMYKYQILAKACRDEPVYMSMYSMKVDNQVDMSVRNNSVMPVIDNANDGTAQRPFGDLYNRPRNASPDLPNFRETPIYDEEGENALPPTRLNTPEPVLEPEIQYPAQPYHPRV